jgi:thiol-disulfide isomerase/thioredoxin
MHYYLTVAVIGVGTLSLVNLWLTLAMARRLREQGERLSRQGPRFGPRPDVGPPPGSEVPDFTVTTVTGTVVTSADLRGERSLIGFFMPGCEPCHGQIPAFIGYARNLPGGPAHALAIIANSGPSSTRASGNDADHLIEELAGSAAAQVITEPSAGVAATVLAVTGYPSFILLDAGGNVEGGAHAIPGLNNLPALAS